MWGYSVWREVTMQSSRHIGCYIVITGVMEVQWHMKCALGFFCFCCVMFCCGLANFLWIKGIDLPIFFRVATLAPGQSMMTSSNGNIFCITGPSCGEFTGHRWIPLTKASDVELWFFSLICVWINSWVNNHKAGDLRCHHAHYDVTVMHKIALVPMSKPSMILVILLGNYISAKSQQNRTNHKPREHIFYVIWAA